MGLIADNQPVRDADTSEITEGGDLDVFTRPRQQQRGQCRQACLLHLVPSSCGSLGESYETDGRLRRSS
jgi:hypothetical protein